MWSSLGAMRISFKLDERGRLEMRTWPNKTAAESYSRDCLKVGNETVQSATMDANDHTVTIAVSSTRKPSITVNHHSGASTVYEDVNLYSDGIVTRFRPMYSGGNRSVEVSSAVIGVRLPDFIVTTEVGIFYPTRVIGSGTYGAILECKSFDRPKDKFAVKISHNDDGTTDSDLCVADQLQARADALDGVVRHSVLYRPTPESTNSWSVLAMEMMDGDLFQYVAQSPPSETRIAVASAVAYEAKRLYDLGFEWTDMKAANCLYRRDAGNIRVVAGDIGGISTQGCTSSTTYRFPFDGGKEARIAWACLSTVLEILGVVLETNTYAQNVLSDENASEESIRNLMTLIVTKKFSSPCGMAAQRILVKCTKQNGRYPTSIKDVYDAVEEERRT